MNDISGRHSFSDFLKLLLVHKSIKFSRITFSSFKGLEIKILSKKNKYQTI